MSKNDNQDLLDLCTLNQLEEHSVGTEEDEAEWKQAIAHSKQRVMHRIRAGLPPVNPSMAQEHRERNHVPDCTDPDCICCGR